MQNAIELFVRSEVSEMELQWLEKMSKKKGVFVVCIVCTYELYVGIIGKCKMHYWSVVFVLLSVEFVI